VTATTFLWGSSCIINQFIAVGRKYTMLCR
jgi:hypothetical protein